MVSHWEVWARWERVMSYERHEQNLCTSGRVFFSSARKTTTSVIRFCFWHCILDIQCMLRLLQRIKGKPKKTETRSERGIRVEF